MGCPFHDETTSGDDETTEATDEDGEGTRGIDRREFVKAALTIGGVGAIVGLGSVAGMAPEVRADSRAPIDAATRSNRQHAWDAFETTAPTENTAPPANSLFLMLTYDHEGEPSPGHRRTVRRALREIERHFAWHHGGVLFTVAYSAAYFDRFDDDPPAGAVPTPSSAVVDYSSDITPYDPVGEEYDAVLLLASDNAANLLVVEEALWGDDEGTDVSFDATFEGVFEKPEEWPDRRVGFAGGALPRDRYRAELGVDVPDDAPLSMGFVAGFDASIPAEDAVTLTEGQRFPGPGIDEEDVPTDLPYVGPVGERDPGMFAQGTLKHLSFLELELETDPTHSGEDDGWYDLPLARRRHQIYSPYHTAAETGETGLRLTEDPGGDPGAEEGGDGDVVPDLPARSLDGPDYADETPTTAAEGTALTGGEPTTGHSQKAARARYDVDGDGELEQPCLRRDWDAIRPAENEYERAAGYHFNVPMRFNESIFTLLDATYSVGFRSLDGLVEHEETGGPGSLAADGTSGRRNGIVPFMQATRRANYLVPPITLRALPYPRATHASIEAIERIGDVFRVTLAGAPGPVQALETTTVRFGRSTLVNKAGGATPSGTTRRGRTIVFEFPAAETGIEGADEPGSVKLFGTCEGTLRPVVATAEWDSSSDRRSPAGRE